MSDDVIEKCFRQKFVSLVSIANYNNKILFPNHFDFFQWRFIFLNFIPF